tara:strand:- start:643 stop:1377 length:735 start_codon:yes stop_codon:yes gene_type:complete
MMKILVIGESCRDIFHYGHCNRLCPEAPVPVFNSTNLIENGGMAMNVFSNVKSLGAEANIITNSNWKTITKTRFVEKRSNHMFMRLDENDDKYEKCDISDVDFSLFDAVIVSDYNKGYLDEQTMEKISNMHVLTFLDTKKRFGKWCENFTFIKVNNSEYENNLNLITPTINDRLIVTKGPKGCVYRDKFYPVPLVEVKDTSGAGDTFISGLCFKFCKTKDIDESIKFANICATQAVQKKGVVTI